MKRALSSLAAAVVLAGCGADEVAPTPPDTAVEQTTTATAPPKRAVALVTAETEDRLFRINLASGRIERQIAPAADPQFVSANLHAAVVASPGAGAVTVLDPASLRTVRVLRGFGSPHIVEVSRDGRVAYVTDDERGELSAIRLSDGRLLDRIFVGPEAHHSAIRPDGREIWIALGETARAIATVGTANPSHLRLEGQFDPGYPAHGLLFTPNGRRVWITSSDTEAVGVFDARTRRQVSSLPGGTPPQEVVFGGRRAYLTSGYGSQIEMVTRAGRVLKVAHAPYGSFNLDAGRGFVVTASLLGGEVRIYDSRLHPLRVIHLAPEARDVAISVR